MKISQALIFLPLALAIPAVHSPHDIEVYIKIKGTEISITDDDDYYSCLVKTYPPDYVDCPDGYVSHLGEHDDTSDNTDRASGYCSHPGRGMLSTVRAE